MANEPDNLGVHLLKSVFGFSAFRPYQEDIIKAICRGEDVFAVMPTGGGKSLCYQFPAVVLEGVCVVISPLLSLMKDQVDSARETGLRAATINSTTSASEYGNALGAMQRKELDLLYISPERFNSPGFVEKLLNNTISFFAIDEAHCISEWGHQFRPDYLQLGRIAELFPGTPIAAFTATATDRVTADIKSRLGLRHPFEIRASFDRPNLDYTVLRKDDLNRQLLDFLKTADGQPGIIYRGTRKKVEETALMLKKHGISALPYHAGMTTEERNAVQESFTYDRVQVVVATIAFGMGIDKPNVRFVIHGDLPKNIEGYYQETGRAGRDGAPARCLLLFGYQDVLLQNSFIEKYEDPQTREVTRAQLKQMIRYAESDECRRKAILRYFGEEYPNENCGHCDYCRGAIKHVDATVDAQKALSAMQRTRNRFGIGHLVDVLVGAKTERIRKFAHDALPTYGVGKDKPKKYWHFLFNALICKGAARMRPDTDYPIPQTAELGFGILRGSETFELIDFAPTETKKRPAKKTRSRGARGTAAARRYAADSGDSDLFDVLRRRRTEIAAAYHIPPYRIFSDSTLLDMAERKPMTPDELLQVSGVGEYKMERYGQDFLDAIAEYIAESPGEEELP
ncbi:MAG: DNA helicase RecQ [Thermoguttaceae bacterium]|nr:DNA helicase RecQ [Thermoguttaceae bacterium]